MVFDPRTDRQRIAIAVDGNDNLTDIMRSVDRIMKSVIGPYVGMVKVNDACHVRNGGPIVVSRILSDYPSIRVGLDFKCVDVETTVANIIGHYAHFEDKLVATVSVFSATGVFKMLQEKFPGIEVIAMGIPSDISMEECQRRFGGTPAQVMANFYRGLTNEYRSAVGDEKALPSPMAVMSFDMIEMMAAEFPGLNPFTPGVRDKWMAADHQKRTTGIRQALELQVRYAVIGAQLTKGNPRATPVISPEESIELTVTEMEAYFDSLKVVTEGVPGLGH